MAMAFAPLILLSCESPVDHQAPEQPLPAPALPPAFRGGTVWRSTDIIVPSDPSSLISVALSGTGNRAVFDRRSGEWAVIDVYLFNAHYGDPLDDRVVQTVEYQVNPEFGDSEAAQVQVMKYASMLGQMPTVLLSGVNHVVIHAGAELWAGPPSGVVIHTGFGKPHIDNGFTEEVFFHEAAHAALDAEHSNSLGWRDAQEADGRFISSYAQDNPYTEDVAESFLAYFALRYRQGGISAEDRAAIEEALPNRIAYFDKQGFDFSPYELTIGKGR